MIRLKIWLNGTLMVEYSFEDSGTFVMAEHLGLSFVRDMLNPRFGEVWSFKVYKSSSSQLTTS